MNIEEIIEKVGRDSFEDYSRRSWDSAKVTGTKLSRLPSYIEEQDAHYHADFDLEFEIAESIWELDISDVSKFYLFFQIYRRAPNYSWLHELELCLWSFSEKTRDVFWSEMGKLISEEDERLVNPARYCLWCGPFEDSKKVNEAWHSILASELT